MRTVISAAGFGARLFVPPPIPTVITTTVPNGQVGTVYQAALQAAGGTTPYTWSIIGALPPGLTLVQGTGIVKNVGVIQGTPTSAGSSSFTALVTDSLAQTDVQAFTLTVGSAPPPPQPVISTSSLAGATVGTAYTASLQASSGTLPFTWSIVSGTLPAGLSLAQGSGSNLNRGIISGTPTGAGSNTIGVQVVDALVQHATKTLTLTVSPKAITPLPQTLAFGSAPSTTNLGTETLQPGAQSPPYPINWDAQGEFVTTPFSCPAGLTQFTIRYAASVAASRKIILDGTTIFPNLSFPATGNFATWGTVTFTRTVTAGDHSMTMIFDVPSGSHDFINPDNLKLTVGTISGGLFTIPPTLQYSASNTGDQTAALQAWLATVPDGTSSAPNTIKGILGQRFRIEGTWYFGNGANPAITPRKNLIFDWNACEYFCTVPNPYGVEAASNIANDWFNYENHGLTGNAPIRITGGLSNTKGISSGVTYWPIRRSADVFQLAARKGETAIPLTGSSDNKINMRNAPAGDGPRAFLFSSDFPGNANFDRIMFSTEGCTNVRFTSTATDGQITGAQTNGTNGDYDARYEAQAGIAVIGGTNVEVDHVDIRQTLGDGVQIIASTTYGQPSFVHIHDYSITGTGRHGISVGNGGATDVTVEDGSIIGAPRHLVDLEDDNTGTTKPLRRVTLRRNYMRSNPVNVGNGWLAMGGESLNMGDIVVGGLLGHPEDGNLVVGVMADDVRNATTAKSTTRRGPYTFGYNVGGGQMQLRTIGGSTTATYSGLTNNTSFTVTQLLQFQQVDGTTLPTPCQINSVNETTKTVVLSHPANPGSGTQTTTVVFGARFGQAAPSGAFDFLHIDGANSFGNTIVVQASSNAAGSIYDGCTGINDHDNNVIGGNDSVIVNPISSSGGKAAVNAHIGNALNGADAHFFPAVNADWAPINFKYDNTFIDADGFTNGANANLAGFRSNGIISVSRCPVASQSNPGGANLVAVAAGAYTTAMRNNGGAIQALSNAQGGVPQWIRIVEWDGDWFGWAIGNANGSGQSGEGLHNNATFHDGSATVNNFCNAVRKVVTDIRSGMTNPAMLKVDLCGGLGLGEGWGVAHDALTFGLWDQVMAQIGDIIDGVGVDSYLNGTPPPPFLDDALAATKAKVIAYGKQFTIGEWGIGNAASGASPPFNYSTTVWTNTWVNFLKGLPASGAGSLAYWCLFDESAPFPDGRGVSHIPTDGPVCKALIESGLA